MKDIGRTAQIYKDWRDKVKKRDKNKCVWPDCKKRAKEVHHIIPYSIAPHLRYEVSNGCCLCLSHHRFIKGKENNFVNLFLSILEKYKK